MQNDQAARADKAARFIAKRAAFKKLDNVVILGSGLAGAMPTLSGARFVDYREIPGFPRATVEGHTGRLALGRHNGRAVAVMQGRFHYYEGHPMADIALPLRALKRLGMERLVITAAVGSMRPSIKAGDIVALTDHINLMGHNPLRGPHLKSDGEMFPDLMHAYDPELRRRALAVCKRLKVRAHEGVYVAVGGPSYETPAEIRAFRLLGADVVGMSVVPEVIVARQMGVRVLGLSWVANLASGLTGQSLTHAEVLALGRRVSGQLRQILADILRDL